MSELKPCPFCGGEAEVHHSVTCGYDSYWVECKDFQNCRGRVSPVTDVESIAIAAWNTRHVETCKLNELDALTQTLSMVNGCAWSECSECGCLTPDDSAYCINCGRKVEG